MTTLADERFVSLTTFRRTGEPVSTPVWVCGEGEELLVMTPTGTGKLKRVRRDPRVELRPCDRRGRVAEGAPTSRGSAVVDEDAGHLARLKTRLKEKYGAEYRVFMAVEAVVRRSRNVPRAVIRIRVQD